MPGHAFHIRHGEQMAPISGQLVRKDTFEPLGPLEDPAAGLSPTYVSGLQFMVRASGADEAFLVNAASVWNASHSRFLYMPLPGDFPTPGYYQWAVKVQWASGKPQTIPPKFDHPFIVE